MWPKTILHFVRILAHTTIHFSAPRFPFRIAYLCKNKQHNPMYTTLKKGSKGSDVTKLQRLLSVTPADGIFGTATESALKQWQATHKDTSGKPLTPDGICGPKTWAALLATSTPATPATPASPAIHINKQPAPSICTHKPGRAIKYIAIHYTAGASSAPGKALATRRDWLSRPKDKQASADFVVDDAEIVQVNPDIRNYYCWSVGGNTYIGYGGASLKGIATNSNVISIEICSSHKAGTDIHVSNHDGWYFTAAALDNATKLVRYLMKEYGIPLDRVIRHYDVNGKPCPGIPGWNDGPLYTTSGVKTNQKNNSTKWLAFKNSLKN